MPQLHKHFNVMRHGRVQTFNLKSMKNLSIFIVLLPNILLAQQPTDSLDYFIQKQVIDYKIPGLAVGIIKDNVVVFKKGYGRGNISDSLPVTTQTIFPILSCTKAFTAAAIGILVDKGKLRWNDKVIRYLPYFKLSNQKVTKELTISDILSHRSGLETFEGDLLWYGTNYSRQEILKRIKYSPVRNHFRKDFGYQNIMYLVAGLIIEKVTGETWDEFIHKEIFLPLSMNNSSTSVNALKGSNYAHPHLKDKPIPLLNMDNIGPAGSVNSNIDDMITWLHLWMNEGAYNERKIFSYAAFQAITSPKVKVSEKSDESYGFGWYIEGEKETKILSHGGGMPGYKSLVIVLPQSKAGIVILTNKISYINEQLAGVILEYVTSKSTNWEKADRQLYGKNFRFSWDEESDSNYQVFIPKLSLYKGVYEDSCYGKAMIEERNGKATLTLLPSKEQFSGPLYYLRNDKLKIVFNDGFVPVGEVLFYRRADKKVSGFKLNIQSSDFHFKHLNFIKK
jgi:CubicO group peptidase (beta-lactamase class C family)